MKKTINVIFFLILSQYLFSQTAITLTIKDVDTKEALPFCNVVIKGTTKGGITNNDGKIKLTVNSENDIIEISYLGYETKVLKIKELNNTNIIFLKAKSFVLNEVVINDNSDYLYEIIDKCRKKMLKNNNKKISKTYFSVETKSDNKVLEFLECYYNANLSGHKINSLDFKNGKTNLNTNIEETMFLSYNTSMSLQFLDLLNKNDHFPSLILQVDKYTAKRKYILKEEERTENYYKISFNPRKKIDKYNTFNGNLWIDKNSFELLKISLKIDSTDIHPFEPQPFINEISNVSLEITKIFNKQEKGISPNYFVFDYSFDYLSNYDSTIYTILPHHRKLSFKINTHSLLYFYDYENPFILPYFDYRNMDNDYNKMATFPYNKAFWNNSKKILITETQQNNLKFLNYSTLDTIYDFNSEKEYGISFLASAFKDNRTSQFWHYVGENIKPIGISMYNYFFWDKNDRFIISEHIYKVDNNKDTDDRIHYNEIKYKFKVQILLDITELEDSIHWQSFTVFDPFQSYFYDTINANIFACINIYFDLCEIIRLEMEEKIQKNHKTVKEITEIYNETKVEIENMRKKYFLRTDLGINRPNLKQYNAIVKEKLGIDNYEMFKNFYKTEENR